MPSIEESIYSKLMADTAVTSLIDNRLYPDEVPEFEPEGPFVFYTVTSSEPSEVLRGGVQSIKHRVEFECLAERKAVVKAIAAAVRTSLHGWMGGQVRRSLWAGNTAGVTEDGYHTTVMFDVWESDGAAVALQQGLPRLEVQESGLYLGGELIGPLNLDGYAKTSELGSMAFQNATLVSIFGGSAVFDAGLIIKADNSKVGGIRVNSLDSPAKTNYQLNLSLGGDRNVTFSGNCTLSGTNTGDQDLSALAPLQDPTFLGTISGDGGGIVNLQAGNLVGFLPVECLPPLAIVEFLGEVNDETEMLLLNGQRGDWCTRLDVGTVWILIGDDPTDVGNWRQLSYPGAASHTHTAASISSGTFPGNYTITGTSTFTGAATFNGTATLNGATTCLGGLSSASGAGSYATQRFGRAAAPSASGTGNTCVGTEAGNSLTNGTNNTLVGLQAGSNLTTGSNNTIFGRQILAPAADSVGMVIFGGGFSMASTVNYAVVAAQGGSVNHSYTVALGVNVATSRDNQFALSRNIAEQTFFFETTGTGGTNRPVAYLLRSAPVATEGSQEGQLEFGAYYIGTAQTFVTARGASGGVKGSFYGVTPVARQTITGSRSSGAALASLLTACANVGIFIDSTSA